jgi:hypothetical protein
VDSRKTAAKLYSNAKANAKRRSLPFSLSLDWIVEALEGGTCAATGLPFDNVTRHSTRLRPLSPSLDRIKPRLGYVDSNCRVVCAAFNVAKADFGESMFRVLAEQYLARTARLADSRSPVASAHMAFGA